LRSLTLSGQWFALPMQADGEEPAPSGEEKTSKSTKEPAVTKTDDDWGKFYSMPPKWNREGEHADEDKRDNRVTKTGLTDENIGHRLASLLRYHLDESHGISTDDDGWVAVDDIVKHADDVGLGGCTAEDLVRVAETNEHSTRGKRFESDGAGKIKATYRHPPKDGRNRWDDWRGSKARPRRSDRPRGGYSWGNGWDSWRDYGGWQDEDWARWKQPGFSPSPDDAIVRDSNWAEASGQAATSEAAAPSGEVENGKDAGKKACEWEQWFVPDSMEMYFCHKVTEEVFFPHDADDLQEKGWARYEDTDGARKGKIYWWHEASDRSFYEEDAIGADDATN